MVTRIRQAIITLIALVTFVAVGAQLVGDFHNWECTCTHIECDWCVDEWSGYHAGAFTEYADQFTALFNAVETKWAKNGRLMIRQGDSGPFKFARKA